MSEEWKTLILPTFKETSKYLQEQHNLYPFNRKINKIYTASIPHQIKREYFIYALENSFCAGWAYGGTCHKFLGMDSKLVNKLIDNNLGGTEYKHFVEHFKYKYVLYNDGNTLSDRTRLLLNINSVIIKKSSQYEEFYSYLLKNKINYIEYNNCNELKPIYNLLEQNNNICEKIVENNKNFVKNVLNYENILEYTYYLLKELMI